MPFEKGKSGNPNGKPIGAKGQKTLQWEALGEAITGTKDDIVMAAPIESAAERQARLESEV